MRGFMKRCAVGLFSLLLPCCLLAAGGTLSAAAETKTQDLTTLDKAGDLVIHLTYDKGKPAAVAFVSPSGTVYAEGSSDTAVFQAAHGDGWSTYKIINAPAGKWQIRYDKGANDGIQVSVMKSTENLWIQSLKMTGLSGTTATVQFSTSYAGQKASFQYTLYAVAGGGDGDGQRQLLTGTATSEETVTLQADLSPLSSYSASRLRLEVYRVQSGAELFDQAETDPFAYTNPNEAAPMSGMDVTVNTQQHVVKIDWKAYAAGGNGYFISLTAPGETEPFYYEDLEPGVTATSADYAASCTSFTISLYSRHNDVLSQPLVRSVTLPDASALRIDTPDVTNSAQAVISHNFNGTQEVSMTLNEKKETLNVSGKGTLSVPLTDGENKLELTYSATEGLSFAVSRAIYLDRVAPEIRLYEPLEAKTFTTSKLVITGETEGNAALTINDKAVTLQENGSFAFTVSLNNGENVIRLKAVDPAGNASVQVLTLNRRSFLAGGTQSGGSGWTDWLPLMIAGGVSLLGIGAALLFFKKRPLKERKPKPVKKRGALLGLVWITGILTLLSAGGSVLSLLRFLKLARQVNSAAYLTLAETSFQDAYLLLVGEQRWWTIMWILAVAALVLLALTILLILLYRRRKKRSRGGTPEQPSTPPTTPPPSPPTSIPPQI